MTTSISDINIYYQNIPKPMLKSIFQAITRLSFVGLLTDSNYTTLV